MKNRFSFAIAYICLLALLTLGMAELLFGEKDSVASNTENRMLQAFPKLSGESFFSAGFMGGFEDWLSDAFPGRDGLADASDRLMEIFAVKDPDASPLDLSGMELFEEQEGDEDDRVFVEEASAEQETPVIISADSAPASLWLVNSAGKTEQVQHYTAEEMATLAAYLNEYRELLPEDGSVSFINVPTSDIAYKVTDGSYTDWGSDVDEVLQPMVEDGVYIYDATDIFRPYMDTKELYPTGDHHWHSFGAWLTLSAMLERQGVPVMGYLEYDYNISDRFDGFLYTRENAASVTPGRESFLVMKPVAPVDSYVLTHLTFKTPNVFIQRGEAGYRQFLGGSYSPWRLFENGGHTGRNALVIGDSFSNCFITYLSAYYDTVLSTDFRDTKYKALEAGASGAEYMAEYGIDDVYIITCTMTPIDGSMLQGSLHTYLWLSYD